MEDQFKNINKHYVDCDSLNYEIRPSYTNELQTVNFFFVQTEGRCTANIVVRPEPNSKSKINIYIYAENDSEVDCVCTLEIDKDVSGVETDVQIRSWPFDRSKIRARPDMKIANSSVKAAHGNALGTVNDIARYYLASRGIGSYKELIKQSLLEHA